MSGFKRATLTISEDEYRRLHDADMKLRFMQKEPVKASSTEKSGKAINAFLDQFMQRQDGFENYMESLGNEIGAMEGKIAQALVAQQTEFYREHWQDLHNMGENFTGIVDTLSKEFQSQISDERQRLNNQIQMVDRQAINIAEERQQKYALAETWIHSAGAIADFIEQEYEYDRFTPGQFEQIDQELSRVQENYNHGMPEAAVLGAQEAYANLSQLRIELEHLTNEWQLLFQIAWKAASRLYKLVANNSTCAALDTHGRELPLRINLEQWSGNNYLKLIRTIETVLQKLQTGKKEINIWQLTDYVSKILPGLEKEFDTIIYEARLAAINSQLRINIADIALRALEEQGFVMEGAGYVGDHWDNPYLVGMRNIEGSKVIIHVDPISNLENTNSLVIESQDSAQRTEHELKRRSQEIFNALLRYGLRAGPISAYDRVQTKPGGASHYQNFPERNNRRARQFEDDRAD